MKAPSLIILVRVYSQRQSESVDHVSLAWRSAESVIGCMEERAVCRRETIRTLALQTSVSRSG